MTPAPDRPPQQPTACWLLIALCWTLIAWLNTPLAENPIVYMILTGLLIVLAMTIATMLAEHRRQKRRG